MLLELVVLRGFEKTRAERSERGKERKERVRRRVGSEGSMLLLLFLWVLLWCGSSARETRNGANEGDCEGAVAPGSLNKRLDRRNVH